MRALILVFGLVSAPVAAADQFDLNCTGKYRPRTHAKWKPVAIHLRIDLAAQAFCRDECQSVHKIDEIDPGTIRLRKGNPQPITSYSYQEIDRVAGTFESYEYGGFAEQATCTAAPFSGFPTAKF